MNKLFTLFFVSLVSLTTGCATVVPNVNAGGMIQPRSRVDVFSNYVFIKNASSADSIQMSLCGVRYTTFNSKADTANVQLPYRLCGTNAKIYLKAFKYGKEFGWAMNNYQTNYVTGNYYYGNNYPRGCQYQDWVITDQVLSPNDQRYQQNPYCSR